MLTIVYSITYIYSLQAEDFARVGFLKREVREMPLAYDRIRSERLTQLGHPSRLFLLRGARFSDGRCSVNGGGLCRCRKRPRLWLPLLVVSVSSWQQYYLY